MKSSPQYPPARQPRPFDRTLSAKLDYLQIALDSAPAWNKRAWLRFQKRLLELRVPRHTGKAVQQ